MTKMKRLYVLRQYRVNDRDIRCDGNGIGLFEINPETADGFSIFIYPQNSIEELVAVLKDRRLRPIGFDFERPNEIPSFYSRTRQNTFRVSDLTPGEVADFISTYTGNPNFEKEYERIQESRR